MWHEIDSIMVESVGGEVTTDTESSIVRDNVGPVQSHVTE
jgi:hypothetical protein